MSITLSARKARPAIGLILLTMALGVLIVQIDACVVNLAVKPIGTDLKAGVSSAKACRTPVVGSHQTKERTDA